MSLSLIENVIVAEADNHPHMLDKTQYSSWSSHMLLYIKGKEHCKPLVDLVLNGPFQFGTIVVPGNETNLATVRKQTYIDLTDEEKLCKSMDIKATNIFCKAFGLPISKPVLEIPPVLSELVSKKKLPPVINDYKNMEKSFMDEYNESLELKAELAKKHDNIEKAEPPPSPLSLELGAAIEWFKKDCIGSVTTWEDLVEKFIQKFYQLSYNNKEMEADEDNDPDDIAEIFKIKGNLFDYETPLCKEFNEFNNLLKIDTNLFTFDVQEIKTYKEYELNNNMSRDLKEPWSDNETLTDSATIENYPGWNYGANNAGETRDSQEHKNEHRDPSVCRVRRLEMIKHLFNADDEYVAIKEHEYFNHSRTNIDACQAYRELFRIMDEGWLVTKVKEE
nr:hypothetical protein [Tanacetum cinerariifolium]